MGRTDDDFGNPLIMFSIGLAMAFSGLTAPGWTAPFQQESSATPELDAQTAGMQEFLDRMSATGQRGVFGRRMGDRHVRNSAGQIVELRLKKAELLAGDAKLIGRLQYLEKLDLAESNVSDEDVRQFESLQSLKELSLSNTEISGIAVATVGAMRELRTVDLSRTNIRDRDLRHLQPLLDLSFVMLNSTPITDEGLKLLGDMPQLTRIALGNTKVTDAGMQHLSKLPRLRGVTLNRTKVTDAGLEEVAKISGFEWFAAPGRVVNEFSQRIELGQFDAAREMFAAGVTIPERGNYRLLELEPLEQSGKDQQRGWQRFTIRFHWMDKVKRTDEIMLLTVVVDRGSVLIMNVSIDDERG